MSREKETGAPGILKPGRNCSSIVQSDRFSMLIDSEEYFNAVQQAFDQAERYILIIGWDIDGRIHLQRPDRSQRLMMPLRQYLKTLAEKREDLEIYILNWRWTRLFFKDREWFSRLKWRYGGHPRMHYQLDSAHPIGGCHHQKIVVIDGLIGFIGGIDLTHARWDSPEHLPDDPRRRQPGGSRYDPVHDVQLTVSGTAAELLTEVFRERWYRATGEKKQFPRVANGERWLSGLGTDLHHVPVALANTLPAYGPHPAVTELADLLEQAILSARKYIYLENQYLTPSPVLSALEKVLKRPYGPEVICITSFNYLGAFEKFGIAALRDIAINRLRRADRFGRFEVYFPDNSQNGPSRGIKVHSKVLIIDDHFFTAGSTNLTVRSLHLDSECNLCIESDSEQVSQSIQALRYRLLGHHLNLSVDELNEKIARCGSMVRAVEVLRRNHSITLLPLTTQFPCVDSDQLPWHNAFVARLVDRESSLLAVWRRRQKTSAAESVESPQAVRSWRRYAFKALDFVLMGIAAYLIYRLFADLDMAEVWRALSQISNAEIAAGLLLSCSGYGILASYDLFGTAYLRLPVSRATALKTGFVSQVLNLNLGALVGGLAVRYRLYRQRGLNLKQTMRLYAYCVLVNWLAFILVVGLVLTIKSPLLPFLDLSDGVTRALGLSCCGIVLIYVGIVIALHGKTYSILGKTLSVPSTGLAVAHLVLAAGQWLIQASIIYLILRGFGRFSWSDVLITHAAAALGGVVAHIPGGYGVIEYFFVMHFEETASRASIVAGILVFRSLYYLLPLIFGGIGFFLLASGGRPNG